jgi:uncharacterized membrane protein
MPEENQAESQTKMPMDPDVEANKTIAVLAYISILFLVPMLLKKDSKFAQFHAKQGLVLFIVEIIASFLVWIPVLGWLLGVGLLVLCIVAIVRVLNGEWWEMPYIYDWSKKFNL